MEIVRESLVSGVDHFGWLHFAAYRFQRSLYHQKHAFYFHNVEKWVATLWVSARNEYEFIVDANSFTRSPNGEKWLVLTFLEWAMVESF